MEQIDLIKKKLLLLEGYRANAHQAFHEAAKGKYGKKTEKRAELAKTLGKMRRKK